MNRKGDQPTSLSFLRSTFLAHELLFLLFFAMTEVRLLIASGFGNGPELLFPALMVVSFCLCIWSDSEKVYRRRLRLLAYLPIMAVSYFVLASAVPLLGPPDGALSLQRFDSLLIGGNASLWLERFVDPALTDVFSLLYLSFFGYLAYGLWHYGRGDIDLFTRFACGLFTVYAVGFIGYTILPAAGPYRDLPHQFSRVLSGGWPTDWYNQVVLRGTNRTDCFPCLHFAISAYILFFDYRHHPRVFRCMALPCAGIWLSTLYLRQHYFTDLVGGVLVTLFACRLVRVPEPAPVAAAGGEAVTVANG